MKYQLENNETALIFASRDKTVVGLITNSNDEVVAQVLNPETRPPTEIDRFAPKHRVISVDDQEYVTIILDPAIPLAEFKKTMDPKVCCEAMLEHFGIETRARDTIKRRSRYQEIKNPHLN